VAVGVVSASIGQARPLATREVYSTTTGTASVCFRIKPQPPSGEHLTSLAIEGVAIQILIRLSGD
jgi:hypothetical protein